MAFASCQQLCWRKWYLWSPSGHQEVKDGQRNCRITLLPVQNDTWGVQVSTQGQNPDISGWEEDEDQQADTMKALIRRATIWHTADITRQHSILELFPTPCLSTPLQDTPCILQNPSAALTQDGGTAHDTQHKDEERQPQLPAFLRLVSHPPGRSSLCPITTSPRCFNPSSSLPICTGWSSLPCEKEGWASTTYPATCNSSPTALFPLSYYMFNFTKNFMETLLRLKNQLLVINGFPNPPN